MTGRVGEGDHPERAQRVGRPGRAAGRRRARTPCRAWDVVDDAASRWAAPCGGMAPEKRLCGRLVDRDGLTSTSPAIARVLLGQPQRQATAHRQAHDEHLVACARGAGRGAAGPRRTSPARGCGWRRPAGAVARQPRERTRSGPAAARYSAPGTQAQRRAGEAVAQQGARWRPPS